MPTPKVIAPNRDQKWEDGTAKPNDTKEPSNEIKVIKEANELPVPKDISDEQPLVTDQGIGI